MTKIDPSLYLNNQSQTNSPSPELGKDDFLKILMMQLQSQDPTDPMDDKDFVAQMATFSSLEQMTNMTNSLDKMVDSQVSPIVKYSHMIGKDVSYQSDDRNGKDEDSLKTGRVVAVSEKDNKIILKLKNGDTIDAKAIQGVQDAEANQADEAKSDLASVMGSDLSERRE